MLIKKRIFYILLFSSVLIIFLLIIFVTNYTSINKIYTENRYKRENGLSLLYGLASTFDAWGNDIDKSVNYLISKKCFDSFGPFSSERTEINLRKASKNNKIIKGNIFKNNRNKIIYINQCIILKDVKILYLAYNTFLSDTKKVYKISLFDSKNNKIADMPSFTDIKTSWMIRNYENYFWGIDFDKYNSINLHIEVFSAEGDFLEAYNHLLLSGFN